MTNHRVLIIHSDRNIRNLLRIFLLEKGFSIKVAATCSYALTMVKKHSFNIILLDDLLPDIEESHVLEIVKDTKWIPLLELSAGKATLDKVGCFGVDSYLVNPFHLQES
ncbi:MULTISPECIES: response regulator transcription factor [unclassified Paenibacillus]